MPYRYADRATPGVTRTSNSHTRWVYSDIVGKDLRRRLIQMSNSERPSDDARSIYAVTDTGELREIPEPVEFRLSLPEKEKGLQEVENLRRTLGEMKRPA